MTSSGAKPLAETPDLDDAFPRLTDLQIRALAAVGSTRATAAGEILFRSGDVDCDFFVVCGGTIALVDDTDGQVVGVHGRGRFLGSIAQLTGGPMFLTAVVQQPGEVLAVPMPKLREIVTSDPALADVILRAFLVRRSLLIGLGAGLRILGSRFSPDTRRLREFAARNRLPHRWIDLEEDSEAESLLTELGVPTSETPVVIWRGREVLRNPSNAELARVIGLPARPMPKDVTDFIVVGAGPAGLGAAVYASSEGLGTMLVDAVATGGQAATSPRIENYLGFPSGISGAELADRAVIQAQKFGVQLSVPVRAVGLQLVDGLHRVSFDDGSSVTGRTLLVATGVRYRKLDVPDLDRFEGTNVYYAATESEAQQCRLDPVAVVGGGNAAGQAALFLAKHTPRVLLLIRGGNLTDRMSRYLADRIERTRNVEVFVNTEVRELVGRDSLEALVVEDNQTGRQRRLEARALFVFIGAAPHTGWLKEQVVLDAQGFVVTGNAVATSNAHQELWRNVGRVPLVLETSRPGVFAAGDVRSGSVKRVAAAVGEGAMASRLVHDHLALPINTMGAEQSEHD